MVTAPLLVQGIQVDLPKTDAQSMTSDKEEIVLSVDERGQLFLSVGDKQAEALTDEDVVRNVGAIVRNNPEQMILIHGDARVPYERVAHAMALLQQAGAHKVGFVTQPREDAP